MTDEQRVNDLSRAAEVDPREPRGSLTLSLRGLGRESALALIASRSQPSQAGRDVVVRLGETLVRDVHLGQAAVHRVGAVVERLDPLMMLLGQVHRLDAVRGGATGHRGRQSTVQVVTGGLDLDPLLLAELRRAGLGLCPRVRVAPPLLGLGFVVLAVVRAEDLELLLGGQLNPHGVRLQFLLDGCDHRGQPGDPVPQQLSLPAEVGAGIGTRIAQNGRDVVQGKAEFAVEQDVLQPLEIVIGVPAITGPAAILRLQQPDLAVVVQRPDRHTCQVGDLPDRVTHACSLADVRRCGRTHRECSLTLRQGQPVFRRKFDGQATFVRPERQPAGPPVAGRAGRLRCCNARSGPG